VFVGDGGGTAFGREVVDRWVCGGLKEQGGRLPLTRRGGFLGVCIERDV
jgi:hypothetical protein